MVPFMEELKPKGVIVMIEAEHMCDYARNQETRNQDGYGYGARKASRTTNTYKYILQNVRA